MRASGHLRRWLLGALSVPCALGLAPANAGAASAPRPVILALRASAAPGFPLPASGARVVVSIRVRHATTCTFLRQRGPFSSLYPLKTVQCSSGRASVSVPAIENTYKVRVRLTFAVRVRGAGPQWVERSVTVAETGASRPPPPPPPSPVTAPSAELSVSPTTLPSTGGTVVLHYSSAGASSCSLSSAPALWTGSDPAPVDCVGTFSATVAPTESAQEWTFTFTATNSAGEAVTATATLAESAPPAPAWEPSLNWSGYVLPSSSGIFTDVEGAWTVPSLDCSTISNGGAGIWVGIGGSDNSGALLQTGITTDCVDGVQENTGWFELFPSVPNAAREFSGFPVSAGDAIQASVFQASTGAWVTKVDDLTTGLSGVMVTGEGWGVSVDAGDGSFTGQGSTATLSYAGGTTAEWIVEDYSQDGSAVTLADFGTVTFSGLKTSLSSWSLTPDEGVGIVQNGVAVSTPSLPTDSGFSVGYTG